MVASAGRACIAALWLAAGCASTVPPPAAEPVRGRLSLTVEATGAAPARGFNAAFDLSGSAEAGELQLSTVLGPQIAVARWGAGRAELDQGERRQAFDSLEALSQQVLGEDVPLRALPDWLAGRPWPGAPSRTTADGFEQLGWQLDLQRWGEGFITAARSSPPPRVVLRVRLERS